MHQLVTSIFKRKIPKMQFGNSGDAPRPMRYDPNSDKHLVRYLRTPTMVRQLQATAALTAFERAPAQYRSVVECFVSGDHPHQSCGSSRSNGGDAFPTIMAALSTGSATQSSQRCVCSKGSSSCLHCYFRNRRLEILTSRKEELRQKRDATTPVEAVLTTLAMDRHKTLCGISQRPAGYSAFTLSNKPISRPQSAPSKRSQSSLSVPRNASDTLNLNFVPSRPSNPPPNSRSGRMREDSEIGIMEDTTSDVGDHDNTLPPSYFADPKSNLRPSRPQSAKPRTTERVRSPPRVSPCNVASHSTSAISSVNTTPSRTPSQMKSKSHSSKFDLHQHREPTYAIPTSSRLGRSINSSNGIPSARPSSAPRGRLACAQQVKTVKATTVEDRKGPAPKESTYEADYLDLLQEAEEWAQTCLKGDETYAADGGEELILRDLTKKSTHARRKVNNRFIGRLFTFQHPMDSGSSSSSLFLSNNAALAGSFTVLLLQRVGRGSLARRHQFFKRQQVDVLSRFNSPLRTNNSVDESDSDVLFAATMLQILTNESSHRAYLAQLWLGTLLRVRSVGILCGEEVSRSAIFAAAISPTIPMLKAVYGNGKLAAHTLIKDWVAERRAEFNDILQKERDLRTALVSDTTCEYNEIIAAHFQALDTLVAASEEVTRDQIDAMASNILNEITDRAEEERSTIAAEASPVRRSLTAGTTAGGSPSNDHEPICVADLLASADEGNVLADVMFAKPALSSESFGHDRDTRHELASNPGEISLEPERRAVEEEEMSEQESSPANLDHQMLLTTPTRTDEKITESAVRIDSFEDGEPSVNLDGAACKISETEAPNQQVGLPPAAAIAEPRWPSSRQRPRNKASSVVPLNDMLSDEEEPITFNAVEPTDLDPSKLPMWSSESSAAPSDQGAHSWLPADAIKSKLDSSVPHESASINEASQRSKTTPDKLELVDECRHDATSKSSEPQIDNILYSIKSLQQDKKSSQTSSQRGTPFSLDCPLDPTKDIRNADDCDKVEATPHPAAEQSVRFVNPSATNSVTESSLKPLHSSLREKNSSRKTSSVGFNLAHQPHPPQHQKEVDGHGRTFNTAALHTNGRNSRRASVTIDLPKLEDSDTKELGEGESEVPPHDPESKLSQGAEPLSKHDKGEYELVQSASSTTDRQLSASASGLDSINTPAADGTIQVVGGVVVSNSAEELPPSATVWRIGDPAGIEALSDTEHPPSNFPVPFAMLQPAGEHSDHDPNPKLATNLTTEEELGTTEFVVPTFIKSVVEERRRSSRIIKDSRRGPETIIVMQPPESSDDGED